MEPIHSNRNTGFTLRNKPFAAKSMNVFSKEKSALFYKSSARKRNINDFSSIFDLFCSGDSAWKEQFWQVFSGKKCVSVEKDFALKPLSYEGYSLLENSKFNVLYLEARNPVDLDMFIRILDEMLVHPQNNLRILKECFKRLVLRYSKEEIFKRISKRAGDKEAKIPSKPSEIKDEDLKYVLTRWRNMETEPFKKVSEGLNKLKLDKVQEICLKAKKKPEFEVETACSLVIGAKKTRIFSKIPVNSLKLAGNKAMADQFYAERKQREMILKSESQGEVQIKGEEEEISAISFGFSLLPKDKKPFKIVKTRLKFRSCRPKKIRKFILEYDEVDEFEIIQKKRRRNRSKKTK